MRKVIVIFIISIAAIQMIAYSDQTARVAFVFGKAEIMDASSGEWHFLKSGEALDGDDIIRTPPGAILRLKDEQGIMLPVFTGSREQTVDELIAVGKAKLNKIKSRRINSDGVAAIDALPTGSRFIAEKEVSTPVYTRYSQPEIRMIEDEIARLSDETREALRKFLPPDRERNETYPPTNLFKANQILTMMSDEESYLELSKILRSEISVVDETIERMLIYRVMLEIAGVDAALSTSSQGHVFVSFDSGLNPDDRPRITANKSLVMENGKLHIPVRIVSKNDSFIYSWYQGANAARNESQR